MVCGQFHVTSALPSGQKVSSTQWTGSWEDHIASLDVLENAALGEIRNHKIPSEFQNT